MYGTNTPCKNKHLKGSVKPFLLDIYAGLVTPYYKNNTRSEANRAGHSMKQRVESAPS